MEGAIFILPPLAGAVDSTHSWLLHDQRGEARSPAAVILCGLPSLPPVSLPLWLVWSYQGLSSGMTLVLSPPQPACRTLVS